MSCSSASYRSGKIRMKMAGWFRLRFSRDAGELSAGLAPVCASRSASSAMNCSVPLRAPRSSRTCGFAPTSDGTESSVKDGLDLPSQWGLRRGLSAGLVRMLLGTGLGGRSGCCGFVGRKASRFLAIHTSHKSAAPVLSARTGVVKEAFPSDIFLASPSALPFRTGLGCGSTSKACESASNKLLSRGVSGWVAGVSSRIMLMGVSLGSAPTGCAGVSVGLLSTTFPCESSNAAFSAPGRIVYSLRRSHDESCIPAGECISSSSSNSSSSSLSSRPSSSMSSASEGRRSRCLPCTTAWSASSRMARTPHANKALSPSMAAITQRTAQEKGREPH
eukprot:scaffold895_cov315-Pinguiococcus_pyrenoidosus.AAC.65